MQRLRFGVLRSLSVKLAVAMLLVVAAAMALVYLAVLPRLESRLVGAKIAQLEATYPSFSARVSARSDPFTLQELALELSESTGARVVVFRRVGSLSLIVADSRRGSTSADVVDDRFARESSATGLLESGRTERDGVQLAEVAFPAGTKTVLLSAPIEDALANVRLVRRSLLLAAAAALAVSLFVGSLAAWSFTRRIKRLETAAERLAGGDFQTPVEDSGEDEIAELAHAFDHMRRQLAQLDHARREFIANASHELRTPLFSLGGFLELFADEEVEEATRRDFLAEMRAQVDRMTRLATDLLDLSRLDAGQLAIASADVDLTATARTLAEEFRPLSELSGHVLTVDAGEPVHAVGDEERVLRIGRALAENAFRHTPIGTAVTVAVREDEGEAILRVCDEGPGIAEVDRDHLFDRFYRGGTTHASGSGLGLAIAKELAERMDGSIEVASRPGDTVFTLRLPVARREAFSRQNEEASVDGEKPAPTGDAAATREDRFSTL